MVDSSDLVCERSETCSAFRARGCSNSWKKAEGCEGNAAGDNKVNQRIINGGAGCEKAMCRANRDLGRDRLRDTQGAENHWPGMSGLMRQIPWGPGLELGPISS